ncbi:DUF1778 domain-containing protein [Candidatus Chlorohelix sp.]|uniref:type II toxin-antitoxin system TacA family antitoxin n=1 Tax=Candidatus Chlorohelix sp. TaxID=3139201 RepID=UPI00303EEF99
MPHIKPHATKTMRIEARIAAEALAVVRRAAEFQGRSISDFMVTAELEAAYKTIEEEHLIRLSMNDSLRFVEQLLNPPELSAAMERAKAAHTRLIRES